VPCDLVITFQHQSSQIGPRGGIPQAWMCLACTRLQPYQEDPDNCRVETCSSWQVFLRQDDIVRAFDRPRVLCIARGFQSGVSNAVPAL